MPDRTLPVAEIARLTAERTRTADAARRYVASRATDAADCALLLSALGLHPHQTQETSA